VNELIKGFEEIKDGKQRFIKCGICGSLEPKSIVLHMKSKHQDEWLEWLETFKKLRANGASFKEIMWEFGRLFSWTVIKNELSLGDPQLHNHINVKEFFPREFKLEENTVWRFPTRGKWGVHTHTYPGNWTPEIPRNIILKYSEPNNLVLDSFVGGGTTLIECLLLGRNGIGVDINPRAVGIAELRLKSLRKEARKQDYSLADVSVNARWGDARNLDFISDASVDLICTHPPYMNTIVYTESRFDDLSRISDPQEYLNEIRKVAQEFRRIIKSTGHVGIMIGDTRKNGQLVPLGFKLLQIFEEEGFKLLEVFIKEEERCSSNEFYRNHDSIIRIAHEYIFVLVP
jgi:methylase of polypeptide subunit release factors